MYVCVLPVCLVSIRPKVVWSPRIEVTDGCEPPYGCQELSSVPPSNWAISPAHLLLLHLFVLGRAAERENMHATEHVWLSGQLTPSAIWILELELRSSGLVVVPWSTSAVLLATDTPLYRVCVMLSAPLETKVNTDNFGMIEELFRDLSCLQIGK